MKKGNILVVTEWGYEEGLIQSYTLPYLKIIHKINPSAIIYLITQEKKGFEKNKEKRKKVQEELDQYNIVLLPRKYFPAGLFKYLSFASGFVKHLSTIFFKGVKYIHSFCTPAGSYAYLLSRFTQKRLIIDSYEPHAEYMLECGVWNERQFAFKVLNTLEKKQAESAYHLIATTPTMVAHTQKKFGIQLKNWDVKPACVDLECFSYDEEKSKQVRRELSIEDKIVCVYAGKFGDFYLKEEVFDFYQVAFDYWKEKFHVLLLSDLSSGELDEHCKNFNLDRKSFTLLQSPHHLVPVYLSAADFALSPYRPTPSKKFCTPIKNGEYWALGLPVVITKEISVDSDLIEKEGIGYVLKNLDNKEYINAVKKIDELLKKNRSELRNTIRRIAVANRSYSIAETIYKKIYN